MPVVGSIAMSPSTLMYCVRLATNVVAPVLGLIVNSMPEAGEPGPPSDTPYRMPGGEKSMHSGGRLGAPETVRGFDAAPVVVLMSHSVAVVVVALSMPSSGQVPWACATAASAAASSAGAPREISWRWFMVVSGARGARPARTVGAR